MAIEQYMWIIWLVLFVAMLIIEAIGPALVSIWFALGAVIALILSFIPEVAWWIEVIVFVVISIATLLALRPILKLEDITYLRPGAVKIGDVSWTAIPVNKDEKIVENEIIEVVAVNGNKLIVKKVEGK